MTQTFPRGLLTATALILSLSTGASSQAVATEAVPSDKATPAAQTPVDFAFDVRPILSDKCFFCHGPDPEDRQADLRIDVADTNDSAVSAGYLVPGDRESSSVWDRINDAEDPMPPIESHKKLTAEEIEILGQWIDQGAVYEPHWAYAPIKAAQPPKVETAGWSRGAIDDFLLAAMHERGLEPSLQASPARLLRRLYLDLIGLPPTREEVEEFASDPSQEAYAAAVERLLADPRFGEHWASWWLDLVRYGDSVGYHGDQPWSVWPYRDWVINSFNANLPFDEFSRMQLAGDLIGEEAETEQQKNDRLFASAYNRLTPVTAEGGAQAKEYRAIYAADRVKNFGEVWLASTTGCAQCHDHKYDPFTIADYYRLAAVFADIDHADVFNQRANPNWAPYRFAPQNDEQRDAVHDVMLRYEQLMSEHPEAGPYETWSKARSRGRSPKQGPWKQQVDDLVKEREEFAKKIAIGLVTRASPTPHTTRLLPRGNWMDESGPVMQPGSPEFLGGQDGKDGPFSRLDLADWLFEEKNPLTSRVVVNRLWERFFGRGISANTLDVGNQGDPPTHPELVDWLATEFSGEGWDMKHMMRLMVTSQAYRQSSEQSKERLAADPANNWFARQSAKRLPAEVLRDQMLASSGLLEHRLGGPSVRPYQPVGHWAALNFPTRKYKQSEGADLYRRSVYSWMQRTFPHPAMMTFDAPNRESCTAQRSESNTPLQALTLLNETLSVEAARRLAETALQSGEDDSRQIDQMFQTVLLREPTDPEAERLLQLLASQRTYFEERPESAEALCRIGNSEPDESLPVTELAAYTSLGRVLYNLHETLTKP